MKDVWVYVCERVHINGTRQKLICIKQT